MFINVNGIEWNIKSVPSNDVELLKRDGTISLGVTDCNVKCVFISDALHGGLLYKVICHEMCHVFIFSFDYYISEIEEERLADFIATFGRQILGITDDVVNMLFKTKAG